ncbi:MULTISPECIES: Uma2 family endonuclease [unclassified Candidatus Accumulibacter]|uniref:Uma2 family endonuclease n=1 Tax=unclassified Candidatus Accumulibacter TaxID=2619054 RepID=UPI001AD14680|nr:MULTISPECIES: Uma2 family endonuclease [unclassified Candidatus Accumulibacter]MBN8512730.1 Uma2 family endonuclease [Accumulibacter sp.]MBO3701914.1 Uma2 family endonuclease [Accumulibacter sp.]
MAIPQTEKPFDAAAYLAWEEVQAERHEYVAGEVFAMVGVRQSQNVATLNLASTLRQALKGTPCRVFVESVKARVEAANCFFYPDVLVTCDPRDRLTPDYVSHPVLVAEVLSESTAAFDRGGKFAAYRKLDSLQDYVLIDLSTQRVEVFRRDLENHWVLHDYGLGEDVELASLTVRVPVDQIFEDPAEQAALPSAEAAPR